MLSRKNLFEANVVFAIFLSATDLIAARVYTIGFNLYGSELQLKLFFFTAIILASVISLNLASHGLSDRVSITNKGAVVRMLHATRIQAVAVSSLLCIVLFEVLQNSSYPSFIAIFIIGISYFIGIVSLSTLGIRFFRWLYISQNKLILFFLLSSVSLTLNLVFTAIYVNLSIGSRPSTVGYFYGGSGYNMAAYQNLQASYFISNVVSFTLTWLAAAFLMHELGLPLSKLTFWLLASSLFVYLFAQFISLAPQLMYDLISQEDPVFYGFFITFFSFLTKIIGGILFGVSFALMGRSLPQKLALRKYIFMSSLGFALFFTSNQVIVLLFLPYPPYGLVAASFTGVAALLIMFGIYTSAVSMAQDATLRQMVRRTTSKRLSLLDNIAMAETEASVTDRVLELSNRYAREMEESSGVSPNLSSEEVKGYIHDVLKEVNVARVTGLSNPFPAAQYRYIKLWWMTYLETLGEVRCDKSSLLGGGDKANLNNTIFLPGYMGTRGVEDYSFSIDSEKSILFPMLFESLSMSMRIGERSELYKFQRTERDIPLFEVMYDGQLIGNLKDFRSELNKTVLECVNVETNCLCSAEIESVGYWIYLQKVTIGEHVLSLKRKTDPLELLRYRIVMTR